MSTPVTPMEASVLPDIERPRTFNVSMEMPTFKDNISVSENRVLVVWWRILLQQSEIPEMEGSSTKLELLSSPILKEHAMYMDSFLRQLLHIISSLIIMQIWT